jgi:hypothetical protein
MLSILRYKGLRAILLLILLIIKFSITNTDSGASIKIPGDILWGMYLESYLNNKFSNYEFWINI